MKLIGEALFNFLVIVGLGGFICGGLCIACATKLVVSWWDEDLGKKLDEKWNKLIVVSGTIGAIVAYNVNFT